MAASLFVLHSHSLACILCTCMHTQYQLCMQSCKTGSVGWMGVTSPLLKECITHPKQKHMQFSWLMIALDYFMPCHANSLRLAPQCPLVGASLSEPHMYESIIGASLSEPHIDGTTVRFRICIYYGTTVTRAPRLAASMHLRNTATC